jgi:hypothetical protein
MARTTTHIAPKAAALKVIKNMDDLADDDEIVYRMYVLQKIERGEKDIAEGKTFTSLEAKKRLAKWLK